MADKCGHDLRVAVVGVNGTIASASQSPCLQRSLEQNDAATCKGLVRSRIYCQYLLSIGTNSDAD